MSHNVSRRSFLKMAGTVAGAAMLQACAPAAVPGADQSAAMPDAEPSIMLSFWTHNYEPVMAFSERKAEEFKSIHPNVEVEYSSVTTADLDARLFTTLAAGTGPDGFNNGGWNYAQLSANDWLAPVSPEGFGVQTDNEVMDLFIESSLNGLVRDGKLYAVPFEWNALSLYYNRAHFIEAGLDPDDPPQTWEEVTEYANILTKKDDVGNITQPGFQQSYGPGTEWPLKRLHAMLVQAGVDYLDETQTSCALDNQEAIDVIEYYTNWTVMHEVSLQGFEVPGVSGNPFRAGYVSMDLSGPYNPAAIKRANPEWGFKGDDGWDISTFPQWSEGMLKQKASALWRWGLFVNSASENQPEMWAFIHFMVEDWRAVRDEVGYLPSIRGWMDDPENTKDTPWLPVQLEDLDVGVPVPLIPKYQELAKENLEMLERIYDGAQTISESVAEFCQKVDAILASS